jgi:hypothetical protein
MKPFLIALLLIPSITFGTGQTGDRLLYKGEEAEVFGFPLEPYFEKNPPRPEWLTEMNTACYRGYVATWVLAGDELVLKSVSRTEWPDPEKDPVSKEIIGKLFPKLKAPVKADWFSGIISIPRGKILRFEGFTEIREKEEQLTFENGRLMKSRVIDNRPKSRPFRRG